MYLAARRTDEFYKNPPVQGPHEPPPPNMFPMKKTVAALAAAALLAAPSPAFAQDTAISQLSSTSSKGSSKPNYRPDYDKDVNPPEKRALEGSYTGSAPISLAIAFAATAVAVQLIVDFVPQAREAVDKLAEQFNLTHVPGSSEGNRLIPAKEITAFVQSYADQYLPQR